MRDAGVPQDRIRSGEGLALTAYIDVPGNFSTKEAGSAMRGVRANQCDGL